MSDLWPLPPLSITGSGRDRRAFIYTRVSSRGQAERGASLPVQVQQCRAWAEANGIQIYHNCGNVDIPGVWHDSAVSAWKVPLAERPAFRDLWRHLNPGDCIVMLYLNRGWRSVQDFLLCHQVFRAHNLEVGFANGMQGFGGESESSMNRFLLTNAANIAELKSELISERVRESHAERRSRKLSAEGSEEDCRKHADAEISAVKTKKRAGRIKYSGETNDWGDAYRKLRAAQPRDASFSGRIFGYARFSTSDQTADSQEYAVKRAIVPFCEQHNATNHGTFVDRAISAYRTPWKERPEGKKLWDQLQPGDHVFILAADRCFRSIIDMSVSMQELEEKGVVLHFVRDQIRTDEEGGVRLLQSLALAAQWEREDISARMRLSMEARRQTTGIWHGPQVARWLMDIRDAESKGRVLMVDHDDIDRMILVKQMLDNKGKTTWDKLGRNIEGALAERDGRKPVPLNGASLSVFRRQCSPDEKRALHHMITRKSMVFSNGERMGRKVYDSHKTGKKKTEIHPEIGLPWLKKWDREVWQKLVSYVSVKPEIFGDSRDRILEIG